MEFITAIGLDIVAVAIVVYCANAAAKKGFLRTVIQMAAYVVIVLGASFLSRTAAPVIYDRIVEPILLNHAQQEAVPEVRLNAALINTAPRGMLSVLDGAINSIDSLREKLPDSADAKEIADGLINDLADATLRPLMTSAISMIGFVILFSLFSLIVNILLSTLGVVNRLPVIGAFNALLGCAVGILQGLLLVWVLAVLLKAILNINPDGWWIINRNVVDDTFLFKYFMDVNLLEKLRQ